MAMSVAAIAAAAKAILLVCLMRISFYVFAERAQHDFRSDGLARHLAP